MRATDPRKFDTVACVRDIFVDTNPRHLGESFSGPFKQLVEWLEFNHMHGIDHFFFYTFHGTEDAAKEIMTPYMNDGLASRIHFEHYPGVPKRRFRCVSLEQKHTFPLFSPSTSKNHIICLDDDPEKRFIYNNNNSNNNIMFFVKYL